MTPRPSRRWYQRLSPRSLRTRLILLVLGAVLTVQAATVIAISEFRRHVLEDATTALMATTIQTLRAAIEQIPQDQRAEFVAQASQGEWRFELRPIPPRPPSGGWGRPPHGHPGHGADAPGFTGPPDRPRPPQRDMRWADDDPRPAMRDFTRILNQKLGPGTRVALSRGPSPALFVSLSSTIPADAEAATRAWLVMSLERLDPPVRTPLLMVWLGGLGVILLMVAGFSWHITRPLTSLAHAADRLASGQPERVAPSGPYETQALGERFNAMLDALQESESIHRTLLAGLPHDLKGPLSRLRLRTEMLDDAAIKSGIKQDVDDMQHIVEQFIQYVRGTDRGTYYFTPLDLVEWTRERGRAWQGAGCELIITELPDAVCPIQGDAIALGRMLDNLIQNALHHAAPPIHLGLRIKADHYELTVKDHGPGIHPEQREEAFIPFSRLDAARSRSGNVGLGLALVDAIAKAHHGSVELRSPKEGGLEVAILLPKDQGLSQEG
ncbi:MAG: ATP-binding protein [Pigmentiphaga sp.]|nr:ATP-binding protein [Pigmentiphaga sp.]